MRYFSALWARMYRFSANSRATISSTAIFLSQQSRQYFSSPRGSETSLAPHSVHRDLATDFRGMTCLIVVYLDDSSTPRRPETPRAERTKSRRDEALLCGPARLRCGVGARRREHLSIFG